MAEKIKHILLIDDSEPDNFLHVYLLEKYDVADRVHSVLNVEQGLKYLKDLSANNLDFPEVILLDINMPRMNGWEFIDALNDQNIDYSNCQIYILTTSLNPDDQEKALNEYKVAGFFNKPLNYDMIQQVISAQSTR